LTSSAGLTRGPLRYGGTTLSTMNALALAERWDTTAGRLANMRSEGVGPHYLKIGTRVLYRVDDVRDYEDQHLVLMAGAA
jgi:hypothetical protein